jgi:hypothetical protein
VVESSGRGCHGITRAEAGSFRHKTVRPTVGIDKIFGFEVIVRLGYAKFQANRLLGRKVMRRLSYAVGLMVALATASDAYCQNRLPSGSGFGGSTSTPSYGGAAGGSQGMFGSRSLGSSLSAGNRGFAAGSARGGGVGGGQGVAGATLRGDAQAGQITGNERFMRGARQPGQFVGSDTTDLPAALTQLATGGRSNSGLKNRNNRGQNQGNANQPNGNGNGGRGGRNGRQPPAYRTTRVVGFDYAVPKAAELKVDFPQRVAKIPQFQNQPPIELELRNRTAILRGVVATAHDRDLIERLALLEAGISQVQNEITVASTAEALNQPQEQPSAQ